MAARSSVADALSALEEGVRALQESTARDAVKARDGQAELARAVAEQATAHAVLTQWMKDWTAEVTAWRNCIEGRVAAADARLEGAGRDLEQARGAMKVALWVFGTALTLVTGVFSGVMVRVIGEMMSRTAH
ncbi:MAG TPA: hypothetical protein VGM51_04130 [Armatimonadota bacterium]|jgi:hypothetical protein